MVFEASLRLTMTFDNARLKVTETKADISNNVSELC